MTKMTEEEKNRVFALAVLAIARKIKALPKTENIEAVKSQADLGRAEIGRILLEHLTQDQILDLAAGDLAASVAEVFREASAMLMMTTGRIELDDLLKNVSKFCSQRLGQDVEV